MDARHETIHQAIHVQGKGEPRPQLKHAMRRARRRTRAGRHHQQDEVTARAAAQQPGMGPGTRTRPHARVSAAPGMQVHFRDPRNPRQRGANENTNGLPRQHSPKGTNPSGHTEECPDAAAMEPDDRPRKTPDYMKPSEKTLELTDDTATSTPTDTTNTNRQQRCCNNQ
ncbi:MAG: hypothetical protein PUF51_04900 [Bifidobacteriaceae bacterium]|nr:hypothetical protein [Bifidobacteriaceae bacterium]